MTGNGTDIRIELPLPIDITATLINIIGLTYPGAVIKDDSNDKGWRSENRLVLNIPDKERHKSPKKAEKYAKRRKHLDADTEATINELGPNAVAFGLPTHLASIFIAMARAWFEQTPDAKNYIETKLHDVEGPNTWLFTVPKNPEQSPHELRTKAEKGQAKAEKALTDARETIRELQEQLSIEESRTIDM